MQKTLLKSFLAFGAIVLLASFTNKNVNETKSQKLEIPSDVKAIIDNSCYGCHNLESRNEKGKKKLSFDTLDTLEVTKLVAHLGEISEVVEEGEMPPAKFLEFKPEAKLSDEQKEKLINWAEETGEALLK